MANGQARVIELGKPMISAHTEPVHDRDGCRVSDGSERGDSGHLESGQRVVERGSGGLGRIPAAPVGGAKPPRHLDRRAEGKVPADTAQTNGTDQHAVVDPFDGEHSDPSQGQANGLTIHEGRAPGLSEGSAKPLADHRVGVDLSHRSEVVDAPLTQDESLSCQYRSDKVSHPTKAASDERRAASES